MSIRIVEVDESDKKQVREFVKFPINELYHDCPYYVPALVLDQTEILNPKKNPAFDHCEMQLFLAYKEDQIVGRIAAIINYRANEIWKNKNARFGFVDFIDNAEVVDALFKAAETWAKNKGMTAITGPMGFTDLDHEGLLIRGYDKISTMSTTYSYPYYKEHIERLGFEKEVDWQEFFVKVPDEVPERYERMSAMIAERFELKILKFKSFNEIKPYVDELFALLNTAYAPLFGFVPLTEKQIRYYVKQYISMLRWDIITLVAKEDTNELVGFGITVPNLSRALKDSKGKFLPFGWFRLLRDLKSQKNPIADLMLMGIAPDYQGKGVNAMIFVDFMKSAMKNGFKYVESNPELELNSKMVSLWNDFEAENHKTRRAYTKHF